MHTPGRETFATGQSSQTGTSGAGRPREPSSLHAILLSGAKLVVGFGLIAVVLSVLDWHKLALVLAHLDVGTMVWTVTGSLGVLVLLALRWYVMANPIAPLPFLRHLGLYMFGMLLSTFTPANIGSDIFRYASLQGSGAAGLSLVGLFVQEKLLLLIGYMMIMVVLVALIGLSDPVFAVAHLRLLGGSGLGALAGLVLLAAAPKLIGSRWLRLDSRAKTPSGESFIELDANTTGKPPCNRSAHPQASLESEGHAAARGGRSTVVRLLRDLGDAMTFGSPSRLATLLILTLASMVVWLMVVWFLARRLGDTMPLMALCFVAIAVELVRWLPISMQGIGLREGAFAGLFYMLGHDSERGFLLGGTAYLMLQVAIVLAGIAGAGLRLTTRST